MVSYLMQAICLSIVLQLTRANSMSREYEKIFSNVKPSASYEDQEAAAIAVIYRIIPDHANRFRVQIVDDLPLNTFRLFKNETQDFVQITATSGVIACKGFNHYLKIYCKSHVSWDGNRINVPDVLPSVNVTETSPSRFIYYQNVCTWSYSFVWWQWKDWQKHIDWMAVQGITLTLSPAQELIWHRVYTELGLTEDEIADHLAGPAFFAWQRMGNLRGWGGPLSKTFMIWSSKLQKRINFELRALGISVALPAFAGHVPTAFKRIYPNASLISSSRWCRFPDQYCCPLFIDPIDPLFRTVGNSFLTEVIEHFGHTDHIYFCDPFNENQPSSLTPEYMTNVSGSIFGTMRSVDDKAIWLLQAWMFVHNPTWDANIKKAFLTAVPKGRILVLDLQSEQFPQYKLTSSFYGQPFIWNMLHNFGGTLGWHGNLRNVNNGIVAAKNYAQSTMVGVGITPEGINQNYVMYEFALDRAWYQNAVNVSDWINEYIEARYGFTDDNLSLAWEKIRETVYSYNGSITIHGKYTICRRPSINLKPWTWYNLTAIDDVVNNFLQIRPNQVIDNDLFKHDLVDAIRQMAQNKIDSLFTEVVDTFHNKNRTRLKYLSKYFEEIMLDLDEILQTDEPFLLGKWLNDSKALASNQVEEQMFEFNARNQITMWGPTGQIVDYAIKQWAGMMRDYCWPRWKIFLDQLSAALTKKNVNYSEKRCKEKIFKQVEQPFGVDNKEYITEPIGDTIALARNFFRKWNGTDWMYL